MTLATTLCVSLLSVCLCGVAQKDTRPVFACNLKAISAGQRPRYTDLTKRLRTAVRDRTEIDSGYIFTLNGQSITLPEAAEWISLERLCCPFLTLQLSASGTKGNWMLTLTGPQGVKPLLDAEFRAR